MTTDRAVSVLAEALEDRTGPDWVGRCRVSIPGGTTLLAAAAILATPAGQRLASALALQEALERLQREAKDAELSWAHDGGGARWVAEVWPHGRELTDGEGGDLQDAINAALWPLDAVGKGEGE